MKSGRKTLIPAVIWGMMALILARTPSSAHPMGNFSINHYARIEARGDRLAIRYLLDLAEIPTVSERSAMDTDHNGQISAAEQDAYLRAKALSLRDGLAVTVNGSPVPLEVTPVHLTFRPGAGGLDTMLLALDLTVRLPQARAGANYTITYKDTNFAERTGWKEILTVAGPGAKLLQSSVPGTDLSKGLTAYPTDPGIVPPQDMEADFSLSVTQTGFFAATSEGLAPNAVGRAAASNTPQDAFTQSIARKRLTPGLIALSLGLAFVFGAFHALSPGHGKAMVAAYLVGARGTARHAAFLGAVVTITHTIGVFALGLVTLAAAQYIVPERLYPILSAISGLAIVAIGLALLRQRLRTLRAHSHDHAHDPAHDHGHLHTHDHDHPPDHVHAYPHDHEPSHDPAHAHFHAHDHPHSEQEYAHPHTHSHAHETADGSLYYHDHGDGHYHSHHVPDDMPISLKTLLVLGITGGALPCPSALVVMLSAIALHRVAFGLLLITAFSLGLATVLTGIGMLVVYARGFLERLPVEGRLVARLPVVSAALVTVIGLVLVLKAVI